MGAGRKKMEFLYKIFGIVTGLEGKYKVSHNTKNWVQVLNAEGPGGRTGLCLSVGNRVC